MRNSVLLVVKIIRYLTDNNIKWSKKFLFLVPLIYFIIPVDIIPDYYFPAGLLDDAAVFVVMIFILRNMLANYQPGKSKRKEDFKKDKDIIDISEDDYDFE